MAQAVAYRSRVGRGVLAAAVLGSGMALLDGTVVNVALRRIGSDLGASLEQLQWVTNGYLLTLASLILVGGALGDRFGRRRVFIVGVVWFAAASLACGLAQTPVQLVVFRLIQGAGSALLTPGSLAIIQAVYRPADRARAIGAWSGLGGIATAIGPFVGGGLVQYASWRWVFLVNVPVAAATVWCARRYVPETSDPLASRSFDLTGAALAVLGLAGSTFALVEWAALPAAPVAASGTSGAAAAVAFVLVERRRRAPMMPTGLFASRLFS
ncbi:MAG: MFS transporter, partial [Sciscionella sp.]